MSRLHRFYIAPQHNKYGAIPLKDDVWIHDEKLLNQWQRVLRYKAGQEIVLFDGVEHERIYKLIKIDKQGAHLQRITDMFKKIPSREVYLFWGLLKKDKNDWVLQKCTELGVSHFIPVLADRSEKTGFNPERAEKIVIEAAEQCGRSDIPKVREPIRVETALHEFRDKITLYICEQDSEEISTNNKTPAGVLIGPEGGWSEAELKLFSENNLRHLNLHDFTLRAETACAIAVGQLIQ